MLNKLEVLSNALEVLSSNQRGLVDVLIQKDGADIRRLVDSHLTKNQDLITTIIKDFLAVPLEYVAPLPDGYCGEYDPETDPISKVTMKLTERG